MKGLNVEVFFGVIFSILLSNIISGAKICGFYGLALIINVIVILTIVIVYYVTKPKPYEQSFIVPDFIKNIRYGRVFGCLCIIAFSGAIFVMFLAQDYKECLADVIIMALVFLFWASFQEHRQFTEEKEKNEKVKGEVV